MQMHMREVFKRIGWRYTKSYYCNEYQYFYLYMFCRSLWIPAMYYFMHRCDTLNPAIFVVYPLHILMSWYYVSHIPHLVKSRGRELKKI
jgi:hypothetical protein